MNIDITQLSAKELNDLSFACIHRMNDLVRTQRIDEYKNGKTIVLGLENDDRIYNFEGSDKELEEYKLSLVGDYNQFNNQIFTVNTSEIVIEAFPDFYTEGVYQYSIDFKDSDDPESKFYGKRGFDYDSELRELLPPLPAGAEWDSYSENLYEVNALSVTELKSFLNSTYPNLTFVVNEYES
jgi:hypothetical protein